MKQPRLTHTVRMRHPDAVIGPQYMRDMMSWVFTDHVAVAPSHTHRGDVAATLPLIMTRGDVAVIPSPRHYDP
jgi:hypothetical protein